MQTTKANLSVSSVPSQIFCEQVKEQKGYLVTVDRLNGGPLQMSFSRVVKVCKILFIHILPMVIHDLLC